MSKHRRLTQILLVLAAIAWGAFPALAQQPDAAEVLDILVTDKLTGRAVAGAEVIAGEPDPERARWLGTPPTTAEMLEQVAASTRRARTTADGRVRLTLPPGYVILLARTAEGLSAQAWIPAGPTRPRQVTLAVEAEERCVVSVVDAAGAAAGGVRVEVLVQVQEGAWPVWSGLTDARSGTVVVQHWERIRIRFEALEERLPDGTLPMVLVTVALPLGDPPVVRVDPAGAPPEKITLELPKTASLTVMLVDEDDRPVLARSKVTLMSTGACSQAEWRSLGRRATVVTSTGKAEFPRRALAAGSLQVSAESPEGRFSSESDSLDSAELEDQAVTTLRLKIRSPAIVGQVVDAAGRPLANSMILVAWHRASSGWRGFGEPLLTDGEGRFRHPLWWGELSDDDAWEIQVRPIEGDRGALAGIARVPVPARDGVHDVGTIRLAAVPLAAAGRVVDSAGKPVVGVPISVERRDEESDTEHWIAQGDVWGATGADGRFEVRSRLRDGKWALRFEREGYAVPRRVPFEPGDSTILVTMTRSAIVRGRVDLVAGVKIKVGARGSAARGTPTLPAGHPARKESGPTPEWATPGADGSFAWTGLLPGTLDVAVSIDGVEEDGLAVRGLTIEEGSDSSPEVLNPIRVADRIRSVRIEVVDREGQPIEKASVCHPALPGRTDQVRAETDADGVAVLKVANAEPTIGAFKKGWRPKAVQTKDATVRIVLEPGIPLRISIPGTIEAPSGFRLTAAFRPVEGSAREFAWVDDADRQPPLGPDGSVLIGAGWPGDYDVLIVVIVPGHGLNARQLVHPDWIRVSVKDQVEEQRFPIEITQRALDEAVSSIVEMDKPESAPASR